MRQVLVNGAVLEGEAIVHGRAVVLDGGRISAVVAAADAPLDVARIDLEGGLLAPGFIDTQVNGGGGVLFNDSPTAEGIAAIGAAHRRFGTTGFLPTLISDDLEVVTRAIAAVEAAIAAGVPGVLGLHVEGPVLNRSRKGIHDERKFIRLRPDVVALLTAPRQGRTLLTLAPEMATPRDIAELAGAGVIVSAGHTDAGYDAVRLALDAGLAGFTHLFNAMSQFGSREPGVVGAALEDRDSYCGVIVDGRHVHPASLRVAMRAKPLDRFMLVTDAMPPVGADQQSFELQGRRIRVEGAVCVDEAGTLAGSNLDMATAVANAVSMLHLPPATALCMASLYPARFLKLDHRVGLIAPGRRADLLLLDETLRPRRSWIAGREV